MPIGLLNARYTSFSSFFITLLSTLISESTETLVPKLTKLLFAFTLPCLIKLSASLLEQ